MQALTIRFESQLLRFAMPAEEVHVGSAFSNEIAIPFPGVSRVHARLTPTRSGLVLTDLGSKNQFVVNGARTNRVELGPGVAVHLGRAVLTIEDASTGDLFPAYPLSTPARRGHDGGAQTESAQRGSDSASRRMSTAFALIRDIERLSTRARRANTHEILETARQLLGVDCVVLFEQPRGGELAVLSAAGATTVELLESVSAVTAKKKDGSRTLSTPAGLVSVTTHGAGRRNLGVAALFSRKPEPWEIDFLDYFSRKLGEIEGTALTAGTPPTALVEPGGMVVGTSPAMKELLSAIASTVRSRLDVLILGETGTGKELIARMIHDSGPTAGGPYVPINCAAIPSELLEAELFGIQKGVATGVDPRPGLFLRADGGSIFLDEIGELPDALQAKLLRVLQEREILPLGATRAKPISLRVIAASNRNLLQRAAEGKFREDLYYRLKGLLFHLPPLRERKEDIVALALHFAAQAAQEYGKSVRGISRNAMDLLLTHDWPGNVRELQAETARAVLMAGHGTVLQREHFTPFTERPTPTPDDKPSSPPAARDLQTRVESVEREAIIEVLRAVDGNKSLAARTLGITRNGLTMKMRRLGLS
jgi:DNA-binding NtrC family response regulator